MEVLTEKEESYLAATYLQGSLIVGALHQEVRGLLKASYLVEDENWYARSYRYYLKSYRFFLTELGSNYIEAIPTEVLVKLTDHLLYCSNVEKLMSRVSLESLPILLSHGNPKVRELARKRYEELKNGRVN